jgi:hypothetical protein
MSNFVPPELRGWKHISEFIGVLSKQTAKKILARSGLLEYENGRPVLNVKRYEEVSRARHLKKQDPMDYVGFIYILQVNEFFKIGKTAAFRERLSSIQGSIPYEVTVVLSKKVPNYHVIEEKLHKKFAHKRHKLEWFKLTQEDLMTIKAFVDAFDTPKGTK